MQLSASIFKAYDIRGIVPSTLDAAVAEALGKEVEQAEHDPHGRPIPPA